MISVGRTQEGMRYAVLVGDGMADYPLKELDGRTPLEVASIPNMDEISRQGQLGLVRMIPPGLAPGSDVAMLSILGYDPRRYYTGRGPLEAVRLGIELSPEEVAFRCNLITVDDGCITDYSSGHISSREAEELIGSLEQRLGTESTKFYPGVGYRHICVIKDTSLMHVDCTPPHDVIGEPIDKNMPKGEAAQRLRDLMTQSHNLLCDHELNRARVLEGKNPANMIWLWGQGGTPQIPSFRERYGIGGSVISAVDLVKGIAKLIGLEPIEVPGATGYYDTNYEAKGNYAVRCLEKESLWRHLMKLATMLIWIRRSRPLKASIGMWLDLLWRGSVDSQHFTPWFCQTIQPRFACVPIPVTRYRLLGVVREFQRMRLQPSMKNKLHGAA
jgi:2,3-bisphosphoglycerate-independent phosphoglycerate mutase